MMNKFICGSLILAVLAGFSSCKNEEEDIFDDTAANRLETYKKNYATALAADGGKWAMEYFANEEEPGYVFVTTFNPDGTVNFSANNKWTPTGAFATDNSLWEMIGDDGPVLSFNSYNNVFHVFSSPENILGGPTNPDNDNKDIDETGTGHAGDYEFVVMGVSDDGQTVTLQGKKRVYKAYLRKLNSNVNDEEYLSNVYERSHNAFNTAYRNLLMIDGVTGERFVVTEVTESYMNGQLGLFDVYPQDGDAVTQTERMNAVITADGMHFRKNFNISRANEEQDSLTIYDFKFQPDGSLKGTDESACLIRAPFPADLVNDIAWYSSRYEWEIDLEALNGALKSDMDIVANEFADNSKNKRPLRNVKFGSGNYNLVNMPYIAFRAGSTTGLYYLNYERISDNQLKISVTDNKDKNAERFLSTDAPSIATVLSKLAGTYTLSVDDLMYSDKITYTNESGYSFTVNRVKK